MTPQSIIRAWKDEEYRQNLSDEERRQLPENPAGLIELTDANLSSAAGARKLSINYTLVCCVLPTIHCNTVVPCISVSLCP
jgi:mersacidin/lichenicidin family type 2 lantibiotic